MDCVIFSEDLKPMPSKKHGVVIFMAFLGMLVVSSPLPADATEKIRLQLRWDHQFQFAGYYAAKWRGDYIREGFDVEIRSALTGDGKILSAVKEVGEGRADFGVGSADILMGIDKGVPLVLVATIFQQSAAEFYCLPDTEFHSLADFARLRVARNVNDLIDVELQAMLRAEGIDPTDVIPYPHESGINHLLTGKVDVMPGYSISAPYLAKSRGGSLRVIRPPSYGVDFYGDSLFTNRERCLAAPDSVRRFRDATIQGWRYALEHPEEIAAKISQKLPRIGAVQDFSEFNRFQMKGVRELTLYPVVRIGNINPDRWKRMHTHLKKSGIVKNEIDMAEFVFDPEKQKHEAEAKQQRMLLIFLVSILATSAISFGWVWLLRRTVAGRTVDLIAINRELMTEIEKRKETESALKKEMEEREAAEKKWRHLEAQLRHHQKLESVGTLAGGVAHEINNPINGIMNYAQLIKDKSGKNATLIEFSDEIIAESQRVAVVVRNLLTFARDEKESHSPARMEDILETTLSLIRTVIRHDQITLETDIPDDLPGIKCRSQQIRQVFMNLLTNARDALNEKYPGYDEDKIIRVSSQRVEIDGRLWVLTTVEDHGPGIDPETQERMFDPFFTTKPRERGTGLGLSISYGIIQEHHGELQVESEPGRFTRFHLSLPTNNGWDLTKDEEEK